MPGPGRLASAALLALAAALPARADCLDWDTPGAVVAQGTLNGLPPGPVQWRTGTRSMGGGHSDTMVELRWTAPGGQSVGQLIFAEIQDGTPRLRAAGGRVTLRVTYCERFGPCRSATLPYAWDRASGRFAGANRVARDSLASVSCGVASQ